MSSNDTPDREPPAPVVGVRDLRVDWQWQDRAIIGTYGSKLGAYGIAVYAALCYYANKEQISWAGARTIAKLIRCSERQVRESVQTLKSLGLLLVDERFAEDGSQLSNVYTLADPRCIPVTPPPPAHDAPAPLHTVQPPPAHGAYELDTLELESTELEDSLMVPTRISTRFSTEPLGSTQNSPPNSDPELPDEASTGDIQLEAEPPPAVINTVPAPPPAPLPGDFARLDALLAGESVPPREPVADLAVPGPPPRPPAPAKPRGDPRYRQVIDTLRERGFPYTPNSRDGKAVKDCDATAELIVEAFATAPKWGGPFAVQNLSLWYVCSRLPAYLAWRSGVTAKQPNYRQAEGSLTNEELRRWAETGVAPDES